VGVKKLQALIEYLKSVNDAVYIQCHNFPDPDAVSTAFGLQSLFSGMGLKSSLIHEGRIQRDALKNLISHLNIDLRRANEYTLTKTIRSLSSMPALATRISQTYLGMKSP